MSVFDPGAEHTPAYRFGRWDGVERFFRRPGNEFLSGLTRRVAKAIVAAGHSRPEIVWPPGADDPPLAPGLIDFEWRLYQTEAAELAWRARRAAIQCSVRGGKTEIAIEFVRRVGRKTLWLTHLKTLLVQTPERFRTRLGVEVGVVAGKTRTNGAVVVGMVQTLARRAAPTVREGNRQRPNPSYDPEFFKQFGCLVVDEAHHAGAATWQDVLAACTRADYRLALSGTFDGVRSPVDRLRIEGAFGPTYDVASISDLAALGFVAKPRVVMVSVPPSTYPSYEEVRQAVYPGWRADPRALSRLGGRLFREAYDRGVVRNSTRNKLVVDVAVRHAAAGERFLVLCNRVPHAVGLREAIGRRLPQGVPVWVLNGEDPDDLRARVLAEFREATRGSGERRGAVLVATPFFREGVDVPEIDAGFLAGAGESSIAVLQALGRMLTRRPDKPEVLVYDCLDGRDPRHPKDYLARHSYGSRLALYEAQGFSVERIGVG